MQKARPATTSQLFLAANVAMDPVVHVRQKGRRLPAAGGLGRLARPGGKVAEFKVRWQRSAKVCGLCRPIWFSMETSRTSLRFDRLGRLLLLSALAAVGVSTTGCQVDVGGQTLPSPYYLHDDIQYFPSGPEFKLSKEAAAQKAYKDELSEDAPCNGCGQCSNCR